MKRNVFILLLMLTATLQSKPAQAQTSEIAQLLLNVEKLAQFKQILSDMKKGYDILNGGYNTVKNISQGNFSLHKAFLDGLMEVNPEIKKYYKVAGIIDYQIRLVKEYQAAFRRFRVSGLFQENELSYMSSVYGNLFQKSLRNLDELAMIITADKLRMSDDERLDAIDRIFEDMGDKLSFLRHFNNNTSRLAFQRSKEDQDIQHIKEMNNINP
ncbi:MAG: TerB family tellurite resistance protein [Sphingobacterium sp.]